VKPFITPATAGVTMLVKQHPTHVELVRLVVVEEKRGQGLGTRAVQALQKKGRAILLTAVPETGKKNALHRFYKSLGFRPVNQNRLGETVFLWSPQPL